MKNNKNDVSLRVAENPKQVKFHPNKYPYSSVLHNYFRIKGIKTSTVINTLQNHSISENTVKTFLAGSHIPNSYLSHLVEEIWGIKLSSEDFKESK